METVKLFELLNSSNLHKSEQGQRLYDELYQFIVSDIKVELDFSRITFISSNFIFSSIGVICRCFTEEEVSKLLSFKNFENALIEETFRRDLRKILRKDQELHHKITNLVKHENH